MTTVDERGAGTGPAPRVVLTSQGALRLTSDPGGPPERLAEVRRLTRPFEIVWETSGDPARLRDALRDADFLVTENEMAITGEILAEATRLRLIQVAGERCVAIDRAAAGALGVPIATLPLPTSASVAEHTLALMLALARCLLPSDRAVRSGTPASVFAPIEVRPGRATYNWPGIAGHRPLAGASLGILGLGDIGTAVARRAAALGMDVHYWQRRRLGADEEASLAVRWASFDEILAGSDWLSLHLRFTEATRHMIGSAEFARMRPGAHLINTARGPIVEETALVEALRRGRLAGAGLDVYWTEPPPADHPLLELDNVILTPHCAAGDIGFALREVELLFGELRRVWQGHPPSHPIGT